MKTPSLLGLLLLVSIHWSQADQIEQTLDLDQAFQPGQTMLWSPGFQKCWDEMLVQYKLKNPQFTPPNKLANALNSFEWEYVKTVPNKSHLNRKSRSTDSIKNGSQGNQNGHQILFDTSDVFEFRPTGARDSSSSINPKSELCF